MRLHDLRHSAVAILIAQGVHIRAISELLGHSSVAFTLQVYCHLFEETKRETALKMDESKYYDAALSNFERARDCYVRAGLGGEWEETVRRVCAAHFRKSGFIGEFRALAAGAKRGERPSFLEGAKQRWRERLGS